MLVVNLQLRLMDVAGEAQTIGAALNHASLNIANAAGAWLGGLVIAAGYGYRATGVVGAALALAGFVVLVVAALLARRTGDTPTERSGADSPFGLGPDVVRAAFHRDRAGSAPEPLRPGYGLAHQ